MPDLLANLSVCLLAFFALLTVIRDEIPNIPYLCVANKYMYTLVVFSLLPMTRIVYDSKDTSSLPNMVLLIANAVIYIVANGVFAIKWCASRAKLTEKRPERRGGQSLNESKWVAPTLYEKNNVVPV